MKVEIEAKQYELMVDVVAAIVNGDEPDVSYNDVSVLRELLYRLRTVSTASKITLEGT